MPDSLQINVRQLAQYPARNPVAGSDLMLLQGGGLGGPYYAATASAFITTVGLNPDGPFAWGVTPPADAVINQIMTGGIALQLDQAVRFNAYSTGIGENYWLNGPAGRWFMDGSGVLTWDTVAAGTAGAAISTWMVALTLATNGHATLLDTLTVGRDPTAALEVATMGYVTSHTVASWNGRTGAVTLTLADITAAGGAPIAGPVFTGVPAGPTAAPGTTTTQLATTAFVAAAIAAVSPDVHSFNGRSGVVTFLTADFNAATAVLTDPVPTAPTAATTDASGQLATTAFVANAIAANGVNSFNGRHGVVTLSAADITGAGGALLASPAFTGTPNAPTANPGTSTAQLATTAFVMAAVAAATTGVASWNGRTGVVTLSQADIVNAAGWASPSFTGIPLAPTAATATNNTQIATTAFVHAALLAGAPGVSTFNTRSGAVVLTLADVTGVGGAPLAAPAFTGVPTANTAAPGTNTTQLATTAFVAAALAAISTGVTSFNGRTGPVTLQGNDISAAGGVVSASPAFTGVPTAPTATTGDSSFQLATTQFVAQAIAAGVSGVSTWNGRAGAVTMTIGDITGTGGAPVASPSFTGVPQAPTAATATSTQQLATTAFVHAAITALPANVASFNGRTGAVTLTAADVSGVGGAVGSFLPLTGGTLSGNLAVSNTSPDIALNTPASGQTRYILGTTNNLARWQLSLGNNTAESGGGAGSDFSLIRFNDAGTGLDNPLFISRGNGVLALGTVANTGIDNGQCQVNMRVNTNTFGISFRNLAAGVSNAALFYNSASAMVGQILINDTGTSYVTTSDLRLKTNVAPFHRGRELVDKLKINSFNWKIDGSEDVGLIAQDAVGAHGRAVVRGEGDMPWGIDYSKYVPLLIEALQHAHRRIDELERRLH
jgi:hypothetical protein